MNSTNKRTPGARGITPFNRQAAQALQPKAVVVAQLKTPVSAQSVKQPVAPPVYRPQPTPKVLQKKQSASAPQPVQTPRQPVAPSVYRPEVKKMVQLKIASPQHRKSPTAAPVYRPEQKQIVQPKMSSAAPPHTPPRVSRISIPQPKPVKAQTGRQHTIQPMMSSVGSFLKESWYGLTKHEMDRVLNGQPIALLCDPIKGSFTVMNLTADLHVGVADSNQNVNKKFIKVLQKVKALMEYAAEIHHLDVRTGKIALRPTGGVVVKQMIELLAFAGLGFFGQAALKEKLDELKLMRKLRVEKANEDIARIKRRRDKRLQATGLDMVWKAKKLLGPDHQLSPGMAELVSQAEAIRGEYSDDIAHIRSFTGKRTGEFMGGAFFDEHFFLLHTLIGRGGHDDFSLSAFGMANDLPDGTSPLIAQQVAHNENALLLDTEAGERARSVYRNRLYEKRASLRITIYYGKIDDIISAIKMSS
jgi:hypothetical protein